MFAFFSMTAFIQLIDTKCDLGMFFFAKSIIFVFELRKADFGHIVSLP